MTTETVEQAPVAFTDNGNVVAFDTARSRGDRPAPLSDTELVKIRAMLTEFEAIKHGCPMARRLLDKE